MKNRTVPVPPRLRTPSVCTAALLLPVPGRAREDGHVEKLQNLGKAVASAVMPGLYMLVLQRHRHRPELYSLCCVHIPKPATLGPQGSQPVAPAGR